MSKQTLEHNGWQSSFLRFLKTEQRLQSFRTKRLTFGIKFLDLALGGILPDDLVLVGAPSGVGKTNFVTNIARANVSLGKKVHVIALEAYEGEIEDRIHYNILSNHFYKDKDRSPGNINFRGWIDGKYDDKLGKYRNAVGIDMAKLENMHTFYRTKQFTIKDFERQAFSLKEKTDLIIVDHVHYFDIEDDNENRGFKTIVKKIREVTQETGIPVVLVAHLRKKDRGNNELAAGIDEFHGSSDLTKIATKIISIGRGYQIDKYTSSTYFRIPKMRMDGSVTYYAAKLIFDFRTNAYDDSKTQIGILTKGGKNFEMLDKSAYPDWYVTLGS